MKNINLNFSRLFTLAFLPVFTSLAIYLNWDQGPFNFSGPHALGKGFIWMSFVLFSLYSGYCTLHIVDHPKSLLLERSDTSLLCDSLRFIGDEVYLESWKFQGVVIRTHY